MNSMSMEGGLYVRRLVICLWVVAVWLGVVGCSCGGEVSDFGGDTGRKDISPAISCKNTAQCPLGYECRNGWCEALRLCKNNTECYLGEECVNGRCQVIRDGGGKM